MKNQNDDMRVSVLPIMVDPTFGVLYVVLGRSRPVESWLSGSLLWSDFGGMLHAGESIECAAAREIVEELTGTLVTSADETVFAQALREKMFVVQMTFPDTVVFVVRFAWRPSLLFEFATTHRHLTAFSRMARGVPLTCAERMLLCRFRWLQGHGDLHLQKWIHHPAVKTRKQVLPASAIQQAADAMASSLQSCHRNVNVESPMTCTVIDGVRASWVEKDQIELFTIQQLQLALKAPGLTNAHGETIEFAPSFLEIVRVFVKSIIAGQISCSV